MPVQVFDAIAHHAVADPVRIALSQGDRQVSYAALAGFLATSAAELGTLHDDPRPDGLPLAIGIAGADPMQAALADLAVTCAGLTAVHLPPFFSPAQIAHVAGAAGLRAVIGAKIAGLPQLALPQPQAMPGAIPVARDGARRVIFTSGSSGQPKGVIIGPRQMAASLVGLHAALAPDAADRHLSLLPMAQLLEQVAGLYLPLLVGARIAFCPEALAALFGGPVDPVLELARQIAPTTTIVVPALLARIVAGLEETGRCPPESLRYVAVGGAATPPALSTRALACGLPLHEGYGLSECASVVALARPGMARPGMAGQPLDGVNLRIEAGEIVVDGPTVMQGYLGQPPVHGPWRTGDLGRVEQGQLVVEGRRDWMIVTPEGRNISPEWVEAMLGADADIAASCLYLSETGALELAVICTKPLPAARIAAQMADLPAYARPRSVRFLPADTPGLIRPGGGIDRSRIAALCAPLPAHPLILAAKEPAA